MNGFWKRERESPFEERLRQSRPEAPPELVARLADRVTAQSPPRSIPRTRIAGVAVAAAALLGLFASFGGISYASSSVDTAALAVKAVFVAPQQTSPTQPSQNLSSNQANPDTGDAPAEQEYGHKTVMCSNPTGPHPHTIEVDDNAVAAHLAQGDTLGPCPS